MKMKFLTGAAVMLAAVFAAANDARVAAIEFKSEMFKLRYGAVLETLDNVKVLKLVSKSDKGHPQGIVTLNLDPKVENYELSYYVKTENIVSGKSDLYGADIVLRPAKGGALRFSSVGSYKCDIGTMDWKKVTYKINAKRYLKEQPITVTLRIAYAPGTAWYKDVKRTPILPKK